MQTSAYRSVEDRQWVNHEAYQAYGTPRCAMICPVPSPGGDSKVVPPSGEVRNGDDEVRTATVSVRVEYDVLILTYSILDLCFRMDLSTGAAIP